MMVEYRFASQGGDLIADSQTLDRPFLLSPAESHPFLTLRDYFDAVLHFVLLYFTGTAHENTNVPDSVIIRSEKHGALYHVASAEVFLKEQSRKFAVSTALSDRGKACLNQEEILLKQLQKSFHLPYLPELCLKREVLARGELPLAMLMTEWLDGYHEWHSDCQQRICIWDRKRGNRTASEVETFQIYKEATKILALYYDISTSRQIQAWHHAAGDFVVNTEGEKVEVRLTTVRGYEPSKLFRESVQFNPVIALVYFFLDLSVRMRLDRVDGTGEAAWAGDSCVAAVIQGFFEALERMTIQPGIPAVQPKELLSLLKTFSDKEFRKLFQPLLQLYREEGIQDLSAIKGNLDHHQDVLHHLIQTFRG
jgi:hypothetical protein